jgi:hypothetical protein
MAQNLYKTSDSIYILADTIESAADKYKTAKSKEAAGLTLFQSSGAVVAAADNSKLTVSAPSGGVVYPNGITNQTFPVAALVQFNAVAASGYSFARWEDGSGNVLSSSAQYNHVIGEDDITIQAIFTEIPRVLTTGAPSNGASYPDFSAGQNFNKGDIVQFNAVPAAGYNFTNWVDADGNILSASAKYNHTMNETITITAIFTAI